ncbi:Tetraacyldisaccharide 4'-kinase [Candidatus Hartigia pinicola]|nr:Tetraacyldisaccharide 4'-kinase [Candidatus Hartigia pinicola]
MIERIWSGNSWLYILLLPLSFLYGFSVLVRRISYKIGLFRSWKASVPVVIVGNLTVGGNGKTPVVIWIVESLTKAGYRVGVVSRGYGGTAKRYPLVLTPTITTIQAGDEPVLIYNRTKVPVAVAPKRTDAIKILLKNYALDVIVSDDGLQHYALSRDYQIIVIDGKRRFGNGWWLPAGPMREREKRLKTVNAVIINDGSPRKNEILMVLEGNIAVNLLSGYKTPVTELKTIVAMAGIGYPSRFFTVLENKGLQLIQTYAFSDHQSYQRQKLILLTPNNEILLMTEKDAVKCQSFAQPNWWYLPVQASLNVFDEQKILSAIKNIINNYKNICR